ncbi:MAG: arsenate reductase family protein [Clostridia bacterium]|nr:arsenate reductase family protein [Clostridia bacterium]
MNIQIFGTNKCFETKKAQRFFKERGIKFQFVDISKYPMSPGEFGNVLKALKTPVRELVNTKSKDYERSFIAYLADDEAVEDKLFENQTLLITPVVRNGKQATIGFCPEIWKNWD